MPTFVSVFSGIGGFDLGLERAGWTCVGQIELDSFCQRVLQRHWPDVPRWDDVRTVVPDAMGYGACTHSRGDNFASVACGGRSGAQHLEHLDLLCGGFPCQDLSVAGKRAGLSGERSGLFFEFMRLARALSPRWLLLENVPGLLSSADGRDFTRLLYELEQSGYWWAYRILDSRWFGVPQRRRRVFIVGHLGGPVPPPILFEPESRPGHSPASTEAGQDVAYCVNAGAGGSKFGSGRQNQDTFVVRDERGRANGERALTDEPYPLHAAKGPSEQQIVVNALRASDGHHGHSSPRGDGSDNLIIANTLESCTPGSRQRADRSDNLIIAAPLSAGSHDQSHMPGRRREDDENLIVAQVAATLKQRGRGATDEVMDNLVAHTLTANYGKQVDSSDTNQGPPNLILCNTIQPWQQQGFTDIISAGGETDANAKETHAREVLRAVRDAIGTEAFTQWSLGILAALQQAKILQPDLFRTKLGRKAEQIRQLVYDALSREEDHTTWTMPTVWEAQRKRCPSQRWEPPEQLLRELRAYLQELSQHGAQNPWLLRALWQSAEGIGLLQQALSPFQEIRRSPSKQDSTTEDMQGLRGTSECSEDVRQALHAGEAQRRAGVSHAQTVRRLTPL